MGEKRRVILLLFIIMFFTGILGFVLDRFGIIEISYYLPFLAKDNPAKIEDRDFPSEVEKLDHQKKSEKLMEWQELLAKKEEELKSQEQSLKQKLQETDEIKKSLDEERKRLARLANEWNDREKKVKDLAGKVRNMPPEKAKEMMQSWTDFDIIDVMRQIDEDAELEGIASITPYLLTLFNPQRRAEITRKMLLPPLEAGDSEPVDDNVAVPLDNGAG